MEVIIITNNFIKTNFFDVKPELTIKGQAVKFLVQLAQDVLLPEVRVFLDKLEKFRYKINQAYIYNDPAGLEENLLNSGSSWASPCVFVLSQAGNIHAVIVGSISQKRLALSAKIHSPKLWTFCTAHSNYLLDEHSDTIQYVSELFETLLVQNYLDCIELDRVHQETEAYKYLKSRTKFMYQLEIDRKRWLRQLIDPETKSKIEHGSKKTRYNQRRSIKQFHKHFKDKVELQAIKDSSDVDKFIVAASEIVDQTYQRAIGVGIQKDDEDFRKFFHRLAKSSTMRGYLLLGDQEPIAYCYGGVVNGVFDLMATSFLPKYSKIAPGQVLILMTFDKLIEDNIAVFDFGWGESNYKKVLSSHNSHEVDIKLYSKRIKSRSTYFMQKLFIYLNHTIRKKLGEEKIAALRKRFRKILTKSNK